MNELRGWNDLAVDKARQRFPDAEHFRQKDPVLYWAQLAGLREYKFTECG